MGWIKAALYRKIIRPIIAQAIDDARQQFFVPIKAAQCDFAAKLTALLEYMSQLDSIQRELLEQKAALLGYRPQLASIKHELLGQSTTLARLRRSYYYLGGNWGLTQLSTGHMFYVNTDDRQICPWIIFGGTWENFVDDIMWEYIQPGMTVVDVGANIGYYTIKMGLKVGPTGRVLSFEPNPELTPFIAQNIVINGFGNRCILFPVALADKPGQAELLVEPGCMGGGHIKQSWEKTGGSSCFSVELDTLDNRLSDVEQIDFIKIDSEGYEALILKGAQELLGRSPNCGFILEVSASAWERFGAISELLRPICGNKVTFAMTPEKRLVAVELDQVRAYLDSVPSTFSYFLVLPNTPECLERIGRFLPVNSVDAQNLQRHREPPAEPIGLA